MKKYIRFFCVCMSALLLMAGVPIQAEETITEGQSIESFAELAEEKPIYALIYNTFEYGLKEAPKSETNVVKVPSGQQVTLLEAIYIEEELWFYCETVVDEIIYQGYVELANIVSADTAYNEWLNTAGFGAVAYAIDSDGSNIDMYFPVSYRDALKELQEEHPNWTFVAFYTGLDWNTVIDNEMYPSRNLISINAKDEWKSKAEGDYDPETGTYIGKSGSNWVQASREAVEYFMDPSNFLDEKSIFMFEQLTYDTSTHIQSGVEAILRGSWMSNQVLEDGSWNSYSSAFMEIASRTGVSPYHLASRVRQEQGNNGTSQLISGKVSGFEGYYNYFNIKASGSTEQEIIQNGLEYARSKGWNSRFNSLLGGSQTISSSYISKGQDTLYLQKFDVDDSYYGIYSHQYMQNVQAPYSEGRKVYDAYNSIQNIENSFVFKIPVYNNMGAYSGDINAELKEFNLKQNTEGNYYLQGEIVVVEWVDGVSTVPQETPIMYFESTDGTEKIDVFVTATGTNTYYFDRFIGELTPGKQYIFKIESGSDKNISENKNMVLGLGNSSLPGSANLGRVGSQILSYGTDYQGRMVIQGEEYQYVGNINSELMSFELKRNEAGNTYLTGEIVVVEWVDGLSTVPDETPVMKFVSDSGGEIEVFVTPTGTNTYYFDRFVENLSTSEGYYFEISSGSNYNTSPNKSMLVNLDTSPRVPSSAVLGDMGGNTLIYERNENGEMVIRCKSK